MSTERELFEAWYFDRYTMPLEKLTDSSYIYESDSDLFQAFQAGRAAMAEQAATEQAALLAENEQLRKDIADMVKNDADASFSALTEASLVPLELHNQYWAGPFPHSDVRVPSLAFDRARTAFGTSSQDDEKRVYRTLQAAIQAGLSATPPNVEKPALPGPARLPLPEPTCKTHAYGDLWNETKLIAYAKACIEADRAQRGGA